MRTLLFSAVLLATCAAAPAAEYRVSRTPIGRATALFGYNAGHYAEGSNTADWWRYSGVNAARVWSPPDHVEGKDDDDAWGDGVRTAKHFARRRAALRADPLNLTFINWPHFERGFRTEIPSGNRMAIDRAIGELVASGVTPLAVVSRSTRSHTFSAAGTAAGWRDRWEHWQHFYAQAFYLARHHGVERFHAYNEPDHGSQDVTQAEYLERLQLASDAIQSAVEDANRLYGTTLVAQVQAPVSAGSVGKFTPTSGGDPRDDATGWGALVVGNLDSPHPGIGGPTFPLIATYAYQQYNAAGPRFGGDLDQIKRLIAESSGSPDLKLAVTEFNVHTARTFSTLDETLDTPSKSARLGSIFANLAVNDPDELYVFKFSQTDNFGGAVKKNGVHYVDNHNAPFDVGGVTKGGEVIRLFAKGLVGDADLLRILPPGDAPEDLTMIAARHADGRASVFSANESPRPTAVSIDLSPLGLAAGTRITVEEVSATSHGGVTAVTQLPASGVIVLDQPAESVLLVSVDPKPTRQVTLSATDDAMVKSGSNARRNYGGSDNLRAKNDPDNPNARNTTFIKFDLTGVDAAEVEYAVLRVRGVNDGTDATVVAHVYGLADDAWDEATIDWETAPNLAASDDAIATIADNFVEGQGDSAFFVGHLTGTHNERELMIDVSRFVREHGGREASFLVARELRVPGEDVDDSRQSLRLLSKENPADAGPQLLLSLSGPALGGEDGTDARTNQ